jgi:hypothetical protein
MGAQSDNSGVSHGQSVRDFKKVYKSLNWHFRGEISSKEQANCFSKSRRPDM